MYKFDRLFPLVGSQGASRPLASPMYLLTLETDSFYLTDDTREDASAEEGLALRQSLRAHEERLKRQRN